MIVTVTVNAALDRTLTVPVFQIGYRHRSSEVLTLAGGKGINVARALKLLDVPVVATGLAGGGTGARLDTAEPRPVMRRPPTLSLGSSGGTIPPAGGRRT